MDTVVQRKYYYTEANFTLIPCTIRVFNPEVLSPEAAPLYGVLFSSGVTITTQIRWLSQKIHFMRTERGAKVRPTCSIFETLQRDFVNLKHELASRVQKELG
jgi:hypothetical protein